MPDGCATAVEFNKVQLYNKFHFKPETLKCFSFMLLIEELRALLYITDPI